MDIRHLEVFLSVARHGSFTRASAELHLVQSAVSATVASLEHDLGQRLFDRTTRSVDVTAAGAVLVTRARAVLDAVQAARDAVDAVGGGLSGSVRIGYMTNVTLFDIPRLLGHFRSEYPAVTLQLSPSSTGTAGLAEALRRGDLDLAFLAATAQDHPDLRVDVLGRSPLGLVVPAGHPLGHRRRLPLAETTTLDFVDFHGGFGTRTMVDGAFARAGLTRAVSVETSDMADTVALVRNGLGVAFLPRYAVEDDDTVRWIAIRDADLQMSVSVATSRHRTPTAAAARLAGRARESARS